jgi:hypothetical protein
MPSTTPTFGWSYGVLSDGPVDLLDVSELALGIDTTVAGTTTVSSTPTGSISVADGAWTTIATVSITLPVAQQVEIVGWARLVNTGSTRAMVSLQVVDGSTHLFGIGETHMGSTSDSFGDEISVATPRRKVGLAAGAHTLNLQAYKDANGVVAAKHTDTYASQAIVTTAIEASY